MGYYENYNAEDYVNLILNRRYRRHENAGCEKQARRMRGGGATVPKKMMGGGAAKKARRMRGGGKVAPKKDDGRWRC